MIKNLKSEQKLLLDLLKISLHETSDAALEKLGKSVINMYQKDNGVDLKKLFAMGDGHGVTALIYHVFLAADISLPDALEQKVRFKSHATVLQNYRLLFMGKAIIDKLKENNIQSVILKGSTTAAFYPVPELRKTGDLDLLLPDKKDMERAKAVFVELGFKINEEQIANHHISYKSQQGIEIELHTMLAEPFAPERVNRYLADVCAQCGDHIIYRESMGIELAALSDGYHGFYLLLHMLQHFLRAGFGIKLLCDWAVFWDKEKAHEDCEDFLRLIKESGLYGFAQTVTACCITYLGLSPERVSFLYGKTLSAEDALHMSKAMMLDILEAEEFGHSDSERMVVMKGSGIWGYVGEFHHQMHLNFPKAGRVAVFWPVLWTVTLMRFLKNNKTIRKVSARAVLKKAGERSRLVKNMNLFKDSSRLRR